MSTSEPSPELLLAALNQLDPMERSSRAYYCIDEYLRSVCHSLHFGVYTNIQLTVPDFGLPNGVTLKFDPEDRGPFHTDYSDPTPKRVRRLISGRFIIRGNVPVEPTSDEAMLGRRIVEAISRVDQALRVALGFFGGWQEWFPTTPEPEDNPTPPQPRVSMWIRLGQPELEFAKSLLTAVEELPVLHQAVINRSIDWYAQGARSRSELAKFMNLWQSLESSANTSECLLGRDDRSDDVSARLSDLVQRLGGDCSELVTIPREKLKQLVSEGHSILSTPIRNRIETTIKSVAWSNGEEFLKELFKTKPHYLKDKDDIAHGSISEASGETTLDRISNRSVTLERGVGELIIAFVNHLLSSRK